MPTAVLLVVALVLAGCGRATHARAVRPASAAGVRLWPFHYRAHDGRVRGAYIVAPAWYGPRRHPPLPLVVSPHGRGVDGRANARLWGALPGRGRFLVVSPDGEGRRLPQYSWGAPGQIADLAAMPRLARNALRWLRVRRGHVYAVGDSMGGQEVLLLVARAPRLLRGAVAFDAPSDLAAQYTYFPHLPCSPACLRRWKDPIGVGLQQLAREEVGGTPAEVPGAYAERSPLAHAEAIAHAGVPLQLWWSTADVVVPISQQERFVQALAGSPVVIVRGTWAHVAAMRANLPRALVRLGLLPQAPASG